MKPIIAIPAVVGLVFRAWKRKSLTPLGLAVAALTASAHALHPWSAPFALLGVFYFGGTKVTKVCTRGRNHHPYAHLLFMLTIVSR
jgi:uncharacterized membrane protein